MQEDTYPGESAEDRAARLAREAEVAALVDRANDPSDEYDGHHGNDRTEDSLEYAAATNPAIAENIRTRIASAEAGKGNDTRAAISLAEQRTAAAEAVA